MSTTKSLLVELFVEELPPKSLKKLGEAFALSLATSLKAQGLLAERSATTPYATPRRLAAHISAVLAQAEDRPVTHKLMPASVALDASGAPTPALLKKLAALGAEASVVPQLERKPDGKAEALFWTTTVRGAMLAAGLQSALDEALRTLPIPKVMSYQLDDGWSSVNFVRPAHGLVALHGAEVVPLSALGLHSGRNTRGHRFEAQVEPVVLQDADHYAQQLEQQGAVIAAFGHRRAEIVRQLQHAAAPLGLTPIDDEALLDEVTALVERPNVLLCQFEPEFLSVPSECLILTMKANQKYFPLLDAQGKLTNKFLVVSNIRPEDASAIVQGNERVVRPRLADAKFFFDQDRKKGLESRLPLLETVVYHAKLGKLADRVDRVADIARFLASFPDLRADQDLVERSAALSKCDLVTDMVGEFPELQGVMGRYYALAQGEPAEVAAALQEQYLPRFSGDGLPQTPTGTALAVADKLESIAGLFLVGEVPTGDRDPYALRRQAVGILRICLERPVKVPLNSIVGAAMNTFAGLAVGTDTPWKILEFFYDRLGVMMKDRGYSSVEVDAVVSLRPSLVAEVPARLAAVRAFAALPESASLAAANKRIANILKKSESKPAEHVDPAHLVEPAERALHDALLDIAPRADERFEEGQYTESLRELAALKAPVDAFFDSVMVNADEPALRANRLALLARLHQSMNRVADLSKLAS